MVSVSTLILEDHMIEVSCDFTGKPIMVSYVSVKLGGHRLSGSGDEMLLVCHMIVSLSRDQKVMLLYGWQPPFVSHRPARFCANKHCGSGDMFLIWHVISQDHMTQELWDFIGRSPSW